MLKCLVIVIVGLKIKDNSKFAISEVYKYEFVLIFQNPRYGLEEVCFFRRQYFNQSVLAGRCVIIQSSAL